MYTKEEVSLLTAASKTFDFGHGRCKTIVSSQTLNVKDSSGKWVEINNTFIEEKTAPAVFCVIQKTSHWMFEIVDLLTP